MTFGLTTIALMTGGALLYSIACPPRMRAWALYLGSLLAVFLLQPPLPIRFSDFVLPVTTLLLVFGCWWATRVRGDVQLRSSARRDDAIAFGLLLATVIGLSLTRYLGLRITPSRPPDTLALLLVVAGVAAVFSLLAFGLRGRPRARITLLIGLIVIAFAVFKAEPLASALSDAWRSTTGQDRALASAFDLNWLGFSYVAFRLIHTLRDRQMGILPALGLRDYALYALFFPAYTAGPIDRAERFQADTATLPTLPRADASRFAAGGARIATGLFKKFVIADALAFGAALNPVNAEQALHTPALWLLLYGYALRLFFDFSGYSDIAIGIGILFGYKLPENFNAPYLRTNITAFWQSWHMSLSAWARAYIFSPLTRAMIRRKRFPASVITLSGHMATLIVIGMWHGITINFLIWGIWHGLALFVHKQWSDRTRTWFRGLSARPALKRAWSVAGWLLTFHVVVLGWVWFALPDPASSLRVFWRLLGGSTAP